MGGVGDNLVGASLLEEFGCFAERAAGIDHIIKDDDILPLDITNKSQLLNLFLAFHPLLDDHPDVDILVADKVHGQRELPRSCHASGIRRDDADVLELDLAVWPEVGDGHR